MNNTRAELFNYVNDNDVKFVKLTFCDFLGRQRNMSVVSSQLNEVFDHGVSIDSVALTGVGGVDLKLKPVSSLLSVLPWRPHSGAVVSIFCKIANIDGTPYVCDPMVQLENEVAKLAKLGFKAKVATECEFYVFKEDERGERILEPFDRADYCACAPYDKCENLRREVIAGLEGMGLKPISSHHERGMGQNEIDFEGGDPLAAARNFIMFKNAVKNVCSLNGAAASFMPRPISGFPGSGLHLSVNLSGEGADKATASFAEGVMRRYKEITCFANPTLNSYRRLTGNARVMYSENRGCTMRIFNDGYETKTVQLRTPDSTCNIFTVLALVFAAGREGIEKNLKLRAPYESDSTLFGSFEEALEFAEKSEWLRANMPGVFDDVLGSIKRRYFAEEALKTDVELFDFHSDI